MIEKLVLEEPTIKRKEEAISYIKEMKDYNSSFNGTGNLENIYYENWLKQLEYNKNKELANEFYKSPSITYFVVRISDNKIVGMVNIRYLLTKEKLEDWASHIGFSIRPTERKKGYAKISLKLALEKLKFLGENWALLICDYDNIGSNKVIISQGGKLVNQKIYKYDNKLTNYYYISLI